MRDRGPTEVGGFGISADDLFFVTDLQMVRQRTTSVTVAFDDEAVADFFDRQVDAGR
jgi:proteasome lid subunit RPN8/RPN11